MASSRKLRLSPKAPKRIAVALSGGLDSVVLLDTACRSQAKSKNPAVEIYAFHIHHGLQKPADDWLLFCEKLAKKYQIHFDFRLLHLADQKSEGNIEARARKGRYDALAELCEEYGIADLLLAHHQNDQAETVLLQLLRGSGVAGLSGMPNIRELQTPTNQITLWRPLLNQSRAELESYAKEHKLKWVEDPSNQNDVFKRNAIRKQIIPKLEKIQPEAVANLSRSASLMSESQMLLDRLAEMDGQVIIQEEALDSKQLKALANRDLPAANNVMRYWLKTKGLGMPSQERLASWWRDLATVKSDAQLEWMHDGQIIRLWRGQIQVSAELDGEWIFQPVPIRSKKPGLSAAWVKEAQKKGLISFRVRSGAEKLQIKANSPRRSLKNLFQESDVPPWQRHAPLLYIDKELIAIAGVGVSYPHLMDSGPRVWPEWLQTSI
ncbi:tRNA lysidine(34) synthetase TilS [Polynucleobacter sp. MWH-UH2A]|uniref:tRNA lysidine(34) synthetase TilS n=1 Tax=Polynucleobacter sp. MWH-UH2A TaxID=1855617 RepID=UPI001BFE23E7|nr:tRNA lysidine(34) synthetase TilS [Polynucleobacter sp. MWH-UH2A]QWD63211.1 tRNA lysidine(34) synthetase TilS [Polynucleobacter sp. MWH-UH2A]